MVDDSDLTALEHWQTVAAERGRYLDLTTAALRSVTAESQRRQTAIEQLTRMLAETEDAAAERLLALERTSEEAYGLSVRLVTLETIAQERLEALNELAAAAGERLDAIYRLDAGLQALRGDAEQRALQAAELSAAMERIGESDLAASEHWQTVAEERGRYLELTTAALRSVTAESARRQASVEQLTRTLAETEQAAAERLLALERSAEEGRSLSVRLSAIEAVAQERLDALNELSAAAEERLRAMKQLDAALQAQHDDAEQRLPLIAEMTAVMERQDREIERLRARPL